MKVSTRGRYGLRALVDIAANTGLPDDEKCINLKSVAERNGLSESYLEQLIIPMKKAGLVKSIRGAQGGYNLNRDPSEISVAEVIKVLEGSLYPVECLGLSDEKSACNETSCQTCVTKQVWEKLYRNMNDVLESIMLDELVREYKLINRQIES